MTTVKIVSDGSELRTHEINDETYQQEHSRDRLVYQKQFVLKLQHDVRPVTRKSIPNIIR